MYTIERGLGIKWLAVLFAVFACWRTFGAGCTVQSHAITDVIRTSFGIDPAISGAVVTVLTAVVILGGVKQISRVCEKLVPFMRYSILLGAACILFLNRHFLLPALYTIVTSAFSLQSVAGGFRLCHDDCLQVWRRARLFSMSPAWERPPSLRPRPRPRTRSARRWSP